MVRGHVVDAPVEVIRLGAAETEVETFLADGIDDLPPSILDEAVLDMRDLPDSGIDVLLRRGDGVDKRLLQDPGDIAPAPAAGDDLVSRPTLCSKTTLARVMSPNGVALAQVREPRW